MARDTRERLLDVGLDQFARKGLAATTITDIEGEAGLRAGSGSFYRHFSSKDELFFAVVERELERLQQAFQDSAAVDPLVGDARSVLTVEFRRVLTAMGLRDKLMAIIIRDRPTLGPLIDRVHKAMRAGVDINSDVLARLMDAGSIPRRDAGTLAAILTHTLVAYEGSAKYLKEPMGGISPDEVIATLVDLVVT